MKRNILYIAIACMTLFASCKKEINQVLPEAVEMEFGATVDDNGSKTYLDDTSVLWANGDQISVNGTAIDLVAGAGYRYGTFRGKVTPYNTNSYYVGYPASATTFSAGTMSVAIPAAQTYNSTQTLLGYMPMAAYIEGTGNKMTLHFHNAANLLKFQLFGTAGDASKVTRIEITSTTAALTGKIAVTANGTDNVTFGAMSETGNTITLDCGTGVQLGADAEHATAFYVIIPKITTATTLSVRMYCANGAYQQNVINAAASTFNSVNMIYSTAVKEVNAANIAGALPGEFTVNSDGKKVNFSQGNLQWSPSNGTAVLTTHVSADGTVKAGTWRFADQQHVFIGDATKGYVYGVGGDPTARCVNTRMTDASYLGWQDVFCFATSGYNSYEPNRATGSPSSYYQGDIAGTYYDWGLYNPIINGGNTPETWRLLTKTEFEYLLNSRTVNGHQGDGYSYIKTVLTLEDGADVIKGTLLAPDDFNGTLSATISWSTWKQLEAAGVVFLPRTGFNNTTDPSLYEQVNNHGHYWTSTYISSQTRSFNLYFNDTNFELHNGLLFYAFAVRLVRDASNSGGVIEPFELENWE